MKCWEPENSRVMGIEALSPRASGFLNSKLEGRRSLASAVLSPLPVSQIINVGDTSDTVNIPSGLTYTSSINSYSVGTTITANSVSAITWSGGTGTFSITPALPAGLSLDITSGDITGTPTTVTSSAAYTVSATNSVGSTTVDLTIEILAGAPTALTYTNEDNTYSRGVAITANTVSAINWRGDIGTYSISPALPTGLTISAATGEISGTATVLSADASYTITATNTAGTTTRSITIESLFGLKFDLVPGATSPNDLPDEAVVNGTQMTLILACDPEDINLGTETWPCRTESGTITLTLAGGGANPTVTTHPLLSRFDTNERIVNFSSGNKYFEAPDSTLGDITMEDLVFETVTTNALVSGAGQTFIVGKKIDYGVASPGWMFSVLNTNGRNYAYASDGTNTSSMIGNTTLYRQTPFFTLWYLNYGTAIKKFRNGVADSSSSLAAVTGSLTTTQKLRVGYGASGTESFSLSSFRLWKCTSCVDDAGAEALSQKHEPIALGMATSTLTDAPFQDPGRTSTAFLNASGILYSVPAGFERIECRTISATQHCGYLMEPASTNTITQSQTFAASWILAGGAATLTSDVGAAPDGTTTAEKITPDGTAGYHFLASPFATVTDATKYTASIYCKSDGYGFASLFGTSNLPGQAASADLSTCTEAATNPWAAPDFSKVSFEPMANGWCRISATTTTTGTSAQFRIYVGTSAGAWSYTGNTTSGIQCWGGQLEAQPVATSYIVTTTAAATRTTDKAIYNASSVYYADSSTMEAKIVCPDHDSNDLAFLTIGPNVTNDAFALSSDSSDLANFVGVISGTQWLMTAAASDVTNNTLQVLRQSAKLNDINGYFNGVLSNTDTSANMPSASSAKIYLGEGIGYSAAGCLLTRARIWDGIATPATNP